MSQSIRNRIKGHRRIRAGELVPHEFNFRLRISGRLWKRCKSKPQGTDRTPHDAATMMTWWLNRTYEGSGTFTLTSRSYGVLSLHYAGHPYLIISN
jgi:hypothetical protein